MSSDIKEGKFIRRRKDKSANNSIYSEHDTVIVSTQGRELKIEDYVFLLKKSLENTQYVNGEEVLRSLDIMFSSVPVALDEKKKIYFYCDVIKGFWFRASVELKFKQEVWKLNNRNYKLLSYIDNPDTIFTDPVPKKF